MEADPFQNFEEQRAPTNSLANTAKRWLRIHLTCFTTSLGLSWWGSARG